MKYEYLILSSGFLCSLIIGLVGGYIAGITAIGPQEPVNLLILFGSAIVLTWGIIYMILKASK